MMTASKRRQALIDDGPTPAEVSGRKVDKVVKAAWTLFTRDGFQTTSMEAIARDAGVSKATLYAYFPSKAVLFEHLIVEDLQRVKSRLIVPDLSLGIAEALRCFAKQYTRMFLEEVPQQMAFFRILVTEVSLFPELGRRVIDDGPTADINRLAVLLDEARGRGMVDIADCKVAATQFLCLVRGELPLYCALGLRSLTAADVDRTIEDGLRLFLKAYQPATVESARSYMGQTSMTSTGAAKRPYRKKPLPRATRAARSRSPPLQEE